MPCSMHRYAKHYYTCQQIKHECFSAGVLERRTQRRSVQPSLNCGRHMRLQRATEETGMCQTWCVSVMCTCVLMASLLFWYFACQANANKNG